MPKVAVAINSSWNFVNFRANLIRSLVAAGHDVVALAPPDQAYFPHIISLGCRFVPLPMQRHGKSPLQDLRLLISLRRVLRQESPSVFLGYTIKPNIYGSIAAATLSIPVINNIAGLGEIFLKNNWLNHFARFLYRIALRRSKVVFFQNDEQRDFFVSRGIVPPAISRVLPGSGVDLKHFTPSACVRAESDGGFNFLLLSRLLWSKGIAEYVEAGRTIKVRHPNAKFRLLGPMEECREEGVPRRVIERWINEGVIEYLGSTDDVRPFISEADCIVLPTYYPEGTPRCLLEALAMGKPIITTDLPGCRDIIAGRTNGYLCRARDVTSLTDGLEWMLTRTANELVAMGQASRAKAEKEFDEQIVIHRYLEAIGQVLSTDAMRTAASSIG